MLRRALVTSRNLRSLDLRYFESLSRILRDVVVPALSTTNQKVKSLGLTIYREEDMEFFLDALPSLIGLEELEIAHKPQAIDRWLKAVEASRCIKTLNGPEIWFGTKAKRVRLQNLLLRNKLLTEADKFVEKARTFGETIDMFDSVTTQDEPCGSSAGSAMYVITRYALLPHLARSRTAC